MKENVRPLQERAHPEPGRSQASGMTRCFPNRRAGFKAQRQKGASGPRSREKAGEVPGWGTEQDAMMWGLEGTVKS